MPAARPRPASALRFGALTPERWPDLETLFGKNGACAGCWCMYWRKTHAEWRGDKGESNRASLRALVREGPPPGILAYDGDRPVGWCAVAPREEYVALAKSRTLAPVDATPVWSVSCFFIARPYRRQGVSVQLLNAAVEFVRSQGGSVVEGYPVLPKKGAMADAFAWTGLFSAFLKAGFREARPASEGRPIVRREV
ncbi:MAG: GNAT family N-acetyltransferase [Acidobacteriia bacterium]|nr:GNAT family N-acetyltransferase [Terriglobia bacterium]